VAGGCFGEPGNHLVRAPLRAAQPAPVLAYICRRKARQGALEDTLRACSSLPFKRARFYTKEDGERAAAAP